jgi:hypothetical protein
MKNNDENEASYNSKTKSSLIVWPLFHLEDHGRAVPPALRGGEHMVSRAHSCG